MGSETPAGIPAGDVKVIPLEAKDRWRPVDNIRSMLYFVFRDTALRADAMRPALDRLIRNHLPILGARLAEPRGGHGLLEYHLPEAFPDDYALFQWSTKAVASTLEATRLLPRSTPTQPARAACFAPCSVPELEAQWIPSDWPLERRLERPDTPLLLVHITSYTDATVLALSLPHAVADQMGYASVIRAWLQLVAGQEPAPFLELRPGALDGPADISLKELRRRRTFRVTNKAERTASLMGLLPGLVANPREARRILFLPETLVRDLRARHEESLEAEHGEDAAALTNGDVVAATLAKLAHLGRKSPKMVTLISAINGRGRHPALPADRPYLHNCVVFAVARMPIGRDTPLSELAYRHRLSVRRGLEVGSIERDLAVTREMCRRRYVAHVCEPFELSYALTNWCAAWRGIDFAPAVAESGTAAGGDAPAPLVLGQSSVRGVPARFSGQVMCKADHGYWCDFAASSKTVALVERLLESDPELRTL
ncbi:Alpha-1,2-mannosidase family protein [Tolypocladium capitatum]|uniref:Alpha-1,2-mannosidase family protein n=1 Tax=Tolypocladium capitatum TaxID=45235 RepID=A0A2K3QJP8_9HYPO|nr:Alpha-1,2-mannosidase family protein [Tolypocladium capitatum]